jgi:hypothetical protein
MLHFLPESNATPLDVPAPYSEAVARLASVRKALRLVEMFEGKPARPVGDEIRFEQVWPLPPAGQRCLERRSAAAAAAAEAGLETMLGADTGRAPHPAAVAVLSDEIARGIADIEALFARR